MKLRAVQIFICILLSCSCITMAFAGKEETPACIKLQHVSLHDPTDLLNDKHQQKLFSAYLDKCIDGRLLKSIIYDVSKFYMQRGNITTRAYLKNQNIANGQVDIYILNGRIENIIDAKTRHPNARIKTAFAFQKGNTLNLRGLETSLEMMNRVSSSSDSFKIKPGTKPGMSIIEVTSHNTSHYHLKLGLGGRKNLNDKNLYMTGEFILDNPFNINDIIKFNYNGSKVQKAYQSNNGTEANYSFPIASYLIEVVATDFSYRQGVNGINDIYLSSGNTQGLRVRLNKILLRNQKNKLSAALSISHKNTKNYFSNQVIEVSSYRTTLAQADLTHAYVQNWGQLTTTYSYYQGVNWFGARTDGYISAETGTLAQAKLQFKKHSLDSNLLYYFSDRSYQFVANAHLQYTSDLLYDNDKLTVGSDYTVRGYSSFNLYGNNAWYVKNDVTKTWQPNLSPSFLQSVSLSVGLDYGEVTCESDNLSSCGSIVGMAVGLSSQGKHLRSNIVWSKPLKKINTTFKMENLFIFDMTWEF